MRVRPYAKAAAGAAAVSTVAKSPAFTRSKRPRYATKCSEEIAFEKSQAAWEQEKRAKAVSTARAASAAGRGGMGASQINQDYSLPPFSHLTFQTVS